MTELQSHRITEGHGKSSIAPLFQSGAIIRRNHSFRWGAFLKSTKFFLISSQKGMLLVIIRNAFCEEISKNINLIWFEKASYLRLYKSLHSLFQKHCFAVLTCHKPLSCKDCFNVAFPEYYYLLFCIHLYSLAHMDLLFIYIYSKTLIAQKQMACLPWLNWTRFESLQNSSDSSREQIFSEIFLYYEIVCWVYSLELHHGEIPLLCRRLKIYP